MSKFSAGLFEQATETSSAGQANSEQAAETSNVGQAATTNRTRLLTREDWPEELFESTVLSFLAPCDLARLACASGSLSAAVRRPVSWRALCQARWAGRTNEHLYGGDFRALYRWRNGWRGPALCLQATSVAAPRGAYVAAYLLERGGEELVLACSDGRIHEMRLPGSAAEDSSPMAACFSQPAPASCQTIYSLCSLGPNTLAVGGGGAVSIHARALGRASAPSPPGVLSTEADASGEPIPACIQVL